MTTIDLSRAHWPAVTAVSIGTFTIVTSEMLPVGLLTPIGATLAVSDSTAGLTMTAPGLVAAVSAPVLAVTAGRLDRRAVLCALMALLAGANLLAALSPNYPVLLAARVLTGVSIGGFWAFATSLAVRLAPPRSVSRATSMIVGGVSVASVLGVPTGTLIASVSSWRWAFVAIGALALAVFAALALLLPPLPPAGAVGPAELARVWRDGTLRAVLAVTAVLVIGHFAAYTYLRPFLEQSSAAAVSAVLLAYGVAGVAGNFAAGSLAAREPRRVLIALAALIGLATAALPLVDGPILLIVLWGVAYGGVSVTTQLWIIKAGGGEAGTAMLSSIFNAAISAGALIGGRVVDGVSISAVMWLGALLAGVSAVCAGTWGRSTTTGS